MSESGNIAAEFAFRRFCAAGRPLTLLSLFALATLAAISVYDALPPAGSNPSILVRFVQYAYDEPYVCAIVVPMLVAALLGRRHLAEMLLGSLSLARCVAVAVVVPVVTLALSSTMALGYDAFPRISLAHALRSSEGPAWLVFLAGPFAEEMLFQVGVQTKLQRFGWFAAVAGASLPFYAIHVRDGSIATPDLMFFILPAVVSYAAIRQVTKSFGSAALAHVTYNVLGTLLIHTRR